MHSRTRKPLRCRCSDHRLLAFYGLADDGEPYVHVKAYKQGRSLANVVIYGDCEIQCPACERWVILNFRDDGSMDKDESLQPPAEIAEIAEVVDTRKT